MEQIIKDIKHQFFAYRNGIVADTLRKHFTYNVIFGLQIPQLAEIARGLTPSMELAQTLWNDAAVRESRLLATYLFPLDQITSEKALELARETNTVEEADMLAFRVLKRLPAFKEIADKIIADANINDYMKQAVIRHLD